MIKSDIVAVVQIEKSQLGGYSFGIIFNFILNTLRKTFKPIIFTRCIDMKLSYMIIHLIAKFLS